MRKVSCVALMLVGALFSVAQGGRTWEVTITNLTKGQIFSPPIAVTHNKEVALFALGEAASSELSAMAEDGDTSGLASMFSGHDDVFAVATADGPVLPGQSVTLTIGSGGGKNLVSVAGMLVSTNDAFFAVDGVFVAPYFFKRGGGDRYQVTAYAYDAGSEHNSESCGTIPGPPCGNGGVRDTDGAEGYVYFHSGIHGIGDLGAADYDWNGPVAMITINPAE